MKHKLATHAKERKGPGKAAQLQAKQARPVTSHQPRLPGYGLCKAGKADDYRKTDRQTERQISQTD